jgi:hypothetical protein
MSIARRDWVAGRQGGEAHRPVLPNRKAAAPRTLSGGRGRSKKFKTVVPMAAKRVAKIKYDKPGAGFVTSSTD